jgi:hypothetical protein
MIRMVSTTSIIKFRLWKLFPIAVEDLNVGKLKSTAQEEMGFMGDITSAGRVVMFKVSGRQNRGKSAGRAPSLRVI